MLERFLGLSKEEIVENEQMWREERDEPELETTQGQDLRAIGVTPAGLEADINMGQELEGADLGAEAESGTTGTPPTVGTAPAGGATPAPAGVPGV
jgi:hypothetical protein